MVGRNTSFRNPPVFMKSSTQHNAEAAVFIRKKLIQRFTSSSPSGLYVQAVAEAFLNCVQWNSVRGQMR